MSERVKFYLDEHVHPAVAAGLRRRDVDVLTMREAEMRSATDIEHLGLAMRTERVMFTQDDDFLRLHAQGKTHAGIVYVRQQTPIGQIVRGLLLIYQLLSADEMQNRLEFL
jgi:predicted nuclease of predicted toxin-antitoxin system